MFAEVRKVKKFSKEKKILIIKKIEVLTVCIFYGTYTYNIFTPIFG